MPELAPSLQQPDGRAGRDSPPLQCPPPSSARASPWARQQQQTPAPDTALHQAAAKHSPSRLSQMTLPAASQVREMR